MEYLDPTGEVNLFCLQFVSEDRTSNLMKVFVDGWNNQGLYNKTPLQLFVSSSIQTSSMHIPTDSVHPSVNDVFSES